MADVPAGKLRVHLMGEKALGLSSLPVGKGGGGQRGKAPTRPLGAVRPVGGAKPVVPVRAVPPVRPVMAAAKVAAPAAVSGVAGAKVGGLPPMPVSLSWQPLAGTALSTDAKRVELTQLDHDYVKGCTRCALCETRTQTVFGEGDPDAALMFIGEGPGETEDETGRPFVGRAGELLDKQIGAMGLRRDQVFIANIVKCRPPENRQPAPEETSACTPYLLRQIEIVRPKVIVTLGLPSSQFLLQKKEAMGKLRGRWHEWRGIGVMPTYHPAYLLRNYTADARRMVWDDLKMVMERLGLKVGE